MPAVPKRLNSANPVNDRRVAPLSGRVLTDREGIPLVRAVTLYDGLEDNNLGNGLEIGIGKSHQVLKMEGRDEVPRTLSISCGYNLVAQRETTPLDVKPVGTISFGVGGANIEFEFDLLSAMVFNLTATSLNLSVFNPGEIDPDVGYPGTPIFVQAMIGDGGAGRAAINPLRRTFFCDTIDAGQGVLIPVPVGAVSYNVYTTTLGGLGALEAIQSLSPSNSVALTRTVNPGFDVGLGAVGIVQGARGLEISNTGAAAVADVRVVFTLAF